MGSAVSSRALLQGSDKLSFVVLLQCIKTNIGEDAYRQLTALQDIPTNEVEKDIFLDSLEWERVPVDCPVMVDVWAEHEFSLEPYVDGIHAEYHDEVS